MDEDTEALIATSEQAAAAEDGETEEQKDQKEESATSRDKRKVTRSKAYTTAKALNDREQRKLRVQLEYYDKEFKITSNKINLEQAALKRDLRHINPDIQDDPDKGFFVPAGMTREEAEKLRDNKRNMTNRAPWTKKPTRSISLEEFDAMREKRSEALRKTVLDLQPGDIIEEGEDPMKRRKSRPIIPPTIHAVSFPTLAKVVGNAVNVSKKEDRPRKQTMADVVELVRTANKLNLNKKKLVDMVRKSQGKQQKATGK